MKQIILYCLSLLLSLTSLWGQQTIDLLDYVTKYMRDPEFVAERGLYIEDQRGVLHPFVGSWVGEYGDYAYEFSIEILKKRSIANGKKFADGLSVICHIYKRDDNGKWRLYLSNGSVHSEEKIREFYSLIYHPKLPAHDFLYRSTLVGQKGNVALTVLPEGGLQLFYYEPDYKYQTISGPQPFPIWDTYKGQGETVMLRRVSSWTELPYIESGERNEVQDKLYQMIRLGRRFIQSEHFNPKFTNYLNLDLLSMEEQGLDGMSSFIADDYNYGGVGIEFSRQEYERAGRKHFPMSIFFRSNILDLSEKGKQTALIYHRYYQAYMLYSLLERYDLKKLERMGLLLFDPTASWRDNFSALERIYLQATGSTREQLHRVYLELGMRLFELGDFGDTTELRKLLEQNLRGL